MAASDLVHTSYASFLRFLSERASVVFRVWSPYQGRTMSPGARAWMDWHLDLLSTTSKVLVLLNGELAGCSEF